MNRIKKLSAVNLKTPEFSHDLSAVNLILADNFTGKTARLDAVRWVLIGYVPALGKTNAATFQLSCGSAMAVDAELTDGTKIERTLAQKGGSIKGTETITPASFTVPDVLMDTAEYLKLSDRERIKYVFRLVRLSDKWSGETIVTAVEAVEIEDTPDQQAVKKGLVEWVSESDFERNEKDLSVQDWLETLLTELKDRTQKARAALQRMEKTTQGIVELRAKDEDQASAANVNRQIAEKTKERDSLVAKRQAIRSDQNAAAKNAEARAILTKRLAEPDQTPTLLAVRKQAEELEGKVQNGIESVKTAESFARARNELVMLQRDAGKAESELIILTRQYEKDLKAPKCPHCGTKGKKFLEAVEVQFTEKRDALLALIEKLKGQIAIAESKDAEESEKHNAAIARDAEVSKNRQLLMSVRAEISRLEAMVSSRADWQQQLDAMPASEAPVSATETNDAFDAINKELGELQEQHNRYVAAAHEAKRQDEARQQLRTVDAEVKVLSVVTKTVEKLQAEMVADAFASILSDANKFTDGILKSRLEYRDGEIGRFDGTSWVAHRSFSGTEQLVAYAGISVALCQASPIKIVLIDELGRMSMANKEIFVRRIVDLTASGFIDQAICVDVSKRGEWSGFKNDDLTIIEL